MSVSDSKLSWLLYLFVHHGRTWLIRICYRNAGRALKRMTAKRMQTRKSCKERHPRRGKGEMHSKYSTIQAILTKIQVRTSQISPVVYPNHKVKTSPRSLVISSTALPGVRCCFLGDTFLGFGLICCRAPLHTPHPNLVVSMLFECLPQVCPQSTQAQTYLKSILYLCFVVTSILPP